MKHTPEELTAMMRDLLLHNGFPAVMSAIAYALNQLADEADITWHNPRTAAEIRAAWAKRAQDVYDAIK